VSKGAVQSASASISSILPEASVPAKTANVLPSAGKMSVAAHVTSSAMNSGSLNIGIPNLPGMSPLASVETLKKVQEITARLGIPQTTESIPFLSMIQRQPSDLGTAGQHKDMKGPVLRLDAQGREIDEHGNLVERTKISNLSTLKVLSS
jgi:U4/U6 small nuclear ribonucleoprotein PRP3